MKCTESKRVSAGKLFSQFLIINCIFRHSKIAVSRFLRRNELVSIICISFTHLHKFFEWTKLTNLTFFHRKIKQKRRKK